MFFDKKVAYDVGGSCGKFGGGGDWSEKNGAGGVGSDYIWTKRQRRG